MRSYLKIKNWDVKRSEVQGLPGCAVSISAIPALCFEWGFTPTFLGNQDVAVK